MPNRMIREACRTSPTLDQLSDGAERMFWRLTTVADDYGRFEADPRILLSQCFPLRVNRIKTDTIQRCLQEMIACGLVTAYVSGGRKYAFFNTWEKHQRLRAKHSKFPEPTSADIGGHRLSNVAESLDERRELEARTRDERKEIELGGKLPHISLKAKAVKIKHPLPADFAVSLAVSAWAKEKGYDRLESHLDHFRNSAQAKGYTYVDWDAAFKNAIRGNWAKLEAITPEKPGEFDHLPRIRNEDYWICGCPKASGDVCRSKHHGMTLEESYAQ